MACALFSFMACTQETIDEQTAIRVDAPETIKVGLEDSETRIQLNEAQKTVWTKNDLVSVFYKSNANQKWEYRGETGERVAELYRVDAGSASRDMDYVVLAYPYSADYVISATTGNIEAKLPATQYYANGSYGVGSNLMVSRSEFIQFSLKSVCGWLKLQLSGNGEVVKSIKFRGNNGEQVAGLIYVDTATAEATLASEMGGSEDNNAGGNLIFDDIILTEVALDCGEGVTLSKNATAFYISLPPQTFENGFTVDIEDNSGYVMTQSTSKQFVVERNTIQPMSVVKLVNPNTPTAPTPANNEIWYANGSTTEATTPNNVFDVNIVSNTYDAEKGWWVIKFDGEVTKIGDSAFSWCSSLTSVTIGDSVTTIGEDAFYRCSSLTSVYITDLSAWCKIDFDDYYANPLRNGANLYLNNELVTDLVIPSDITEIKPYAFYDCSSLISVTIGDGVTIIGEDAFYRCSSLTSVYITDLSAWCKIDFDDYYANPLRNGANLYLNNELVTDLVIPSDTTEIKAYAFEYCSSLTSVTIPDSVTAIGYEAFYNCSSLTSVYISDLSAWCRINFGSYDENPLYYAKNLYLNNELVTDLVIPSDVTEINNYAFNNCSSLTSVAIPDSVTTIGSGAFSGCRSLTSVTIPDSVTTIGDGAFIDCSSLTSITIPDSVTTIGVDAFDGCTGELVVNCNIPDAYYDYRSVFYGSKFTSVTIGDSVTTIGWHAFSGCSSLTSVTIGDSVTTIGDWAFYNCSNLTSVTIGDSVTTIGYMAFWECSRLTSVTIPDRVTTIGDDAFYNCSSLTSATIGNGVTTIGNSAFNDCSSLTSVTIPDSVTTIGSGAFSYCYSLTSVTIGDSVTTIGNSAFYLCYSLSSVYCKAVTPPAGGSEIFYLNASGRKIYVPTESVEAYKSAQGWNEYADAIVGYNF